MLRRPVLLALLVGFVSLTRAGADVVTTRDGLVIEGAVTREGDGTVVVAGASGQVRIAQTDVLSITTGEGPRTSAEKARNRDEIPLTREERTRLEERGEDGEGAEKPR